MDPTIDQLFELLPAIYRIRDEAQGHPLRDLLRVVNDQAQIVADDISQLYDNWFIETCDEWVAPYIGDLLGVRPLNPVSAKIFSQRAWVANTLGYRRRKGTVAVLEQLARDVTGWPAKAVEFFQLLAHLLQGGADVELQPAFDGEQGGHVIHGTPGNLAINLAARAG